MPTDTLLNAYIDANIMLVAIALILFLGTSLMRLLGYRSAHRTHLRLVNGVLVTLLLLPVVSYVFKGVFAENSVSVSNLAVSLYLDGHIAMSAIQFNEALGMRERIVSALARPESLVTWSVLLGLGGVVLYKIALIGRNMVRLVRILRTSYAVRSIGRINVVSSDQIQVPFTTRGLRKYYVVIPVDMLGNAMQSQVALGHEFQHIRQGDLEWELLLEIVSPLFFLNPAFSAIRAKIRLLREYTCDQEFLAKTGFDRKSYCKCLLDVARRSVQSKQAAPVRSFAVPLVEARSRLTKSRSTNLGKRLLAMAHAKNKRPPLLLTILMTATLSCTVLFTAIVMQPPSGWSHDRIMLSTVVNLERLRAPHNGPIAFAR